MSERKTIQFNPAFLSVGSSNRSSRLTLKNKPKREKPTPPPSMKPNKLRKQLLAKIKDYQKQSEESTEKKQEELTKVDKEFNDEFNKSLGFLQDLASKQKTKKNKTLKKTRPIMSVHTELPKDFDNPYISSRSTSFSTPQFTGPQFTGSRITGSRITGPQFTGSQFTGPQFTAPRTIAPLTNTILPPRPPYSTLKNGSKPTYREWKHHTQKVPYSNTSYKSLLSSHIPTSTQPIAIEDKPMVPETSRSTALAQMKSDYKIKNPSKKPIIRSKRITRTVKYHLGKSGHKVSVLIKNKQTRKKIQNEHALLRQKSIIEIKNYLRKKNLLKTGSNAPNDVLRQMYEQSILSGDINNQNKNTLIHNFLND